MIKQTSKAERTRVLLLDSTTRSGTRERVETLEFHQREVRPARKVAKIGVNQERSSLSEFLGVELIYNATFVVLLPF